ncbi:MAG: NAD+ synthase, partial [Alphaproteobacteria bacterium]|nr:NAD+ synthase [Alphaproteobacteria bacterium]
MKDIKKIKENLVYDLRDFVQSRKFSDVVFGLSGGMDSALVLALAAEALGPQHVHTFMMATKNTSGLSIELAKQLSYNIGSPHQFIDIQPRVDCALKTLPFVPQRRTTVENIQAR